MDSTILEENWNEHKKRLLKRIIDLTESELLFSNSKKFEIRNKLQQKLGKTDQELNKLINE